MLDAFELPASRIPQTAGAQAALYRSLLAGRRMLVLLDNARDAEQVRPLLPGDSSCAVIVTSRDRLTGLVAAQGAIPIAVSPLPAHDARGLLAARLDQRRMAGAGHIVDEIIEWCARLPLALTWWQRRPRQRRRSRWATSPRACALFTAGSTCSTSGTAPPTCAGCSPGRTNAFHPLRQGFSACSGCIQAPMRRCRPSPALPGYRKRRSVRQSPSWCATISSCRETTIAMASTIIRAYALELVDSDVERDHAALRMLDHYLRAAHAAACGSAPTRDAFPLPQQPGGVAVHTMEGKEEGLAWLAAEYRVLLAVIRFAALHEFSEYAAGLGWALEDFWYTQGRWHDWCEIGEIALSAADRCQDVLGQAVTHRSLGRAHNQLCHSRRRSSTASWRWSCSRSLTMRPAKRMRTSRRDT